MNKKINQNINTKSREFKFYLINIIVFFFLFSLLILPLWLNKKFGFLYFEQFKFNITLLYYGYLDGDSNLIDIVIKKLRFIKKNFQNYNLNKIIKLINFLVV